MQSQRSCFRNLTPSFLILSLPDLRSSANATPRLSEDKVKQCVDPKLGAEYPPKAIAKLRMMVYASCHSSFSWFVSFVVACLGFWFMNCYASLAVA
ncbi:hypothetical protein AHAS_Ahas07G0079200 [Arachis hypogaea]